MSFYEDLGVDGGATADEIRERYRVLVRLFHPDRFTDPVFKAAAEGQLRRFNEIESVLCDPERRRVYDLGLARHLPEPRLEARSSRRPRAERRVPWGWLAWGMAALACAMAIVWVSDRESPTPLVVVHSAPSPVGSVRGPVQKENWQARARQAIAERDQALRELARWKGEAPKPAPLPPDLEGATAVSITEASTDQPASEDADKRGAGVSFAGIWLYSKSSESDTESAAPEFIETQITERDGQVRGRYRSRYRVTGRAISPAVNFHFSGQAAGSFAQMPFVRDDGARGEVHLRLLSDRELELAWTATGNTFPPTLSSGTAVLVRAQ